MKRAPELEFGRDAYIRYIYVNETTSQVLRHEEIGYFKILEQNIWNYIYIYKKKRKKKTFAVFVTGGFNSRTGQCIATDFSTFDTYLDVGLNNSLNNDILHALAEILILIVMVVDYRSSVNPVAFWLVSVDLTRMNT